MEDKTLTSFFAAISDTLLWIDSNLCTVHAQRVTLHKKDMELVMTLTQPFGAQMRSRMTAVQRGNRPAKGKLNIIQ